MQPDDRAYIELLQKLNEGYNPLAISVAMRDRAVEKGRSASVYARILEALGHGKITAAQARKAIKTGYLPYDT